MPEETRYPARRFRTESVQELNQSAFDGDGDMRYGSTPEANCHDNTRRAGFAVAAVRAFASVCNEMDEDVETVLSDLLADLRHLCDAMDLDFDSACERGEVHYHAEVTGNWA